MRRLRGCEQYRWTDCCRFYSVSWALSAGRYHITTKSKPVLLCYSWLDKACKRTLNGMDVVQLTDMFIYKFYSYLTWFQSLSAPIWWCKDKVLSSCYWLVKKSRANKLTHFLNYPHHPLYSALFFSWRVVAVKEQPEASAWTEKSSKRQNLSSVLVWITSFSAQSWKEVDL